MTEFNRYQGRKQMFPFKCACCLAPCRASIEGKVLYCPDCWESPWRTPTNIPEFSIREDDTSVECAMCLASLAGKTAIRLPCCKNYYCSDSDSCQAGGIRRWLTAHNTCPFCRYKYHGKNVTDRRERFEEMQRTRKIKISGKESRNELHQLDNRQLLAFHSVLLGQDHEMPSPLTKDTIVRSLLKSDLYELSFETSLKKAKRVLQSIPRVQLWPSIYNVLENDDKTCCVCNAPHEESSIVSMFPCGHFCHSGARSCLSAPALNACLESTGGFPCPHPQCALRLRTTASPAGGEFEKKQPVVVRREHLASLGLEIVRMFAASLDVSYTDDTELNVLVTSLLRSRHYEEFSNLTPTADGAASSAAGSYENIMRHSLLDKFVGGSRPRKQIKLARLERQMIREHMTRGVEAASSVSSPPVLTDAETAVLEVKAKSLEPFQDLPKCHALLQTISQLDKVSFMPKLGHNLVQCLKDDLVQSSVKDASCTTTDNLAAAADRLIASEQSIVFSSLPIPFLTMALIAFAEVHKKKQWTDDYWTEDIQYGAAIKFLLSQLSSAEQKVACVTQIVSTRKYRSTRAALIARGICRYEDCADDDPSSSSASAWQGLTARDITCWRTNELARLNEKRSHVESIGFAYQRDLAQCEKRLEVLRADRHRLELIDHQRSDSREKIVQIERVEEEEMRCRQSFLDAIATSRADREYIEGQVRLVNIDCMSRTHSSSSISSLEQRERDAVAASVAQLAAQQEAKTQAEEEAFCARFEAILVMRKSKGERLSREEKIDETKYDKIQAVKKAQLKSRLKKAAAVTPISIATTTAA